MVKDYDTIITILVLFLYLMMFLNLLWNGIQKKFMGDVVEELTKIRKALEDIRDRE